MSKGLGWKDSAIPNRFKVMNMKKTLHNASVHDLTESG